MQKVITNHQRPKTKLQTPWTIPRLQTQGVQFCFCCGFLEVVFIFKVAKAWTNSLAMGPAVFLVVLFPLKNKNKTADLIGASLLSDSLAMRSAVLCFLFVKAFEVLFCLRLSIVFVCFCELHWLQADAHRCSQLTDAHKDRVLRTLVVTCSEYFGVGQGWPTFVAVNF